MRIVFIGASELGYNCCESCIKEGHSIVGIITLGKEFSIKYKEQKERTKVTNVLYKDFKNFQDQYNIPVIVAEHPIAHAYDVIESWKPDLIIVIGWYYMIPEKIMNLPNKGVIGIHASLLPKYRGNAPLVWAMINGEKETGVSLF
jgi:methionyl-tRNA formyltransferase